MQDQVKVTEMMLISLRKKPNLKLVAGWLELELSSLQEKRKLRRLSSIVRRNSNKSSIAKTRTAKMEPISKILPKEAISETSFLR